MKIVLKLQKLIYNITKYSEKKCWIYDPDASGRYSIDDIVTSVQDTLLNDLQWSEATFLYFLI